MPEHCNAIPRTESIDSKPGVYSLRFSADSVLAADLSAPFCVSPKVQLPAAANDSGNGSDVSVVSDIAGFNFGGRRFSLKDRITMAVLLQSKLVSAEDVAKKFGCTPQYVYSLWNKTEKYWELMAMLDSQCDHPVFFLDRDTVEKMVISLTTICQASGQDVEEYFSQVFNYNISDSRVSNIRHKYAIKAAQALSQVDLSGIETGVHDEIYACGQPIFGGADIKTHYIYLFKIANDASGASWKEHLSALRDSQKLNPEVTINDAGKGLMSGIKAAFPDIVQQIDVFHILREFGRELSVVMRSCEKYLHEYLRLERSLYPKGVRRITPEIIKEIKTGEYPGKCHKQTAEKFLEMLNKINAILVIHDTVEYICQMARHLLDFTGYSAFVTTSLLKWLIRELRTMADNKTNKALIPKIWHLNVAASRLEKRLPHATSFLMELSRKFDREAEKLGCSPELLSLAYNLTAYHEGSWHTKKLIRRLEKVLYDPKSWTVMPEDIPDKWDEIAAAALRLRDQSHRASSLIESINSRIRAGINDFRGMNQDQADLLCLYFNTKKVRRTSKTKFSGTSPLSRLTGDSRSFLEILFGQKKAA